MQRAQVGNEQASLLLSDACIDILNSEHASRIKPEHLFWFTQQHITSLIIAENNEADHKTRKHEAVCIRDLFCMLDNKINEMSKHAANGKESKWITEHLSDQRDEFTNHLLMRPLYPYNKDEDLSYGGLIPAPIRESGEEII